MHSEYVPISTGSLNGFMVCQVNVVGLALTQGWVPCKSLCTNRPMHPTSFQASLFSVHSIWWECYSSSQKMICTIQVHKGEEDKVAWMKWLSLSSSGVNAWQTAISSNWMQTIRSLQNAKLVVRNRLPFENIILGFLGQSPLGLWCPLQQGSSTRPGMGNASPLGPDWRHTFASAWANTPDSKLSLSIS